jgi:hypothetical protein
MSVGNFPGVCSRRPSNSGDDGGIGYGDRRLAKDGVALESLARAGIDPVVVVELLPVHSIALCEPNAPVDGQAARV